MTNSGQKAGVGLMGCGCLIMMVGLLTPVIGLIICIIIGASAS